jgi:hypothetical protein
MDLVERQREMRERDYISETEAGKRYYARLEAKGYIFEHNVKGKPRGRGRLLRPYEALYRAMLRSAKITESLCTLTYEDFLGFVTEQNCHYCSAQLNWGGQAYNLDKKVPEDGYTVENCVTCCKRCNRAKSNLFNYEQWLAIGTFIQENRNKIF